MRYSHVLALIAGLMLFAGTFLYAEEPPVIKTQSLTVEQKLDLLEVIEITSEKELQPIPEAEQDPVIDAILEEADQFEVDSESSE